MKKNISLETPENSSIHISERFFRIVHSQEFPYQHIISFKEAKKIEEFWTQVEQWFADRETHCELFWLWRSTHNATKSAEKRFLDAYPKYNDKNIHDTMRRIGNNINAMFQAEQELKNLRDQFIENEPSGKTLGFLQETDMFEFKMRWL